MPIHLKEIFEKPVDRPIEGVIKADDEASLRQELEEYVITNEVEKRLEHFLDAYNNYETANGVWISGFFGSGKSHLLKMLALVLENRVIDGTPALDIFLQKSVENEILSADLKRAVAIPSKSILFNIDQKADVITKTQIDALLAVFQKVFDEMCGYYGKQGHVAQFERDLHSREQYAGFKTVYQRIAGKTWERGREQALLEGPSIAKAYAEVSGADAASAEGILGKYRSDYKVSIEDFAQQVKDYIDGQGPQFRLNFFVDEVGQYIADNVKLMTNLQTIAESLNTKCRGRAWIVVTAQQEIRAVIGELTQRQENDFSKIQARFANRMSLTSANADEVIQKRLLKKTEGGVSALSDLFHKQSGNFKTLFDFSDGSIHFRNFADRDHFIQSYPFIPYQYSLFQMSIQALSEHNSFEGRHSSVGERSMLGVFQDVAVHIAGLELGGIAPFDMMFEGIRSALKSGVQQSIQIAERNLDNPFAVRVLKALFLVKYVRPFKPTLRNICILLLQQFDQDVTGLRKQVEESVGVLEQQTYIQRNGELFEFLTDEEKDIEQEIKAVEVDLTEVAQEFEQLVFDGIVKSRKIRHEATGHDYPYARRLDDRLSGRDHELAISLYTPFHEHVGNPDAIKMLSMSRDELAVVLKPDDRLMTDIMMYKRTEKYVRQNRATTLQPSVERIIGDKGAQNAQRHRDLTSRLKALLSEARLFVRGEEIDIRAEDAQLRIMKGFQVLVDKVHVNLGMLRGVQYSESDLGRFMKQAEDGLFGNEAAGLSEAEQEIQNFIQGNSRNGVRTTVKAVTERFERKPYGWPYAAVLCNLASLFARGKLEARADGNLLEGQSLERTLKNTQAHGNIVLEPQVEFSQAQLRQLKEFYSEFFDTQPSGTDARIIGKEAADAFQQTLQEIQGYLARKDRYPFLAALEPALESVRHAAGKPYGWYVTDLPKQADSLLDMKEDVLDPVRKFMKGQQRTIYDEARRFLSEQEANLAYAGDIEAREIRRVIDDPACFRNSNILQLKVGLDRTRGIVEDRLGLERTAAIREIEELVSKLKGLPQLIALSESERQRILSEAEAGLAPLRTATFIAVVRERAGDFRTRLYPELLARATSPSKHVAARSAEDDDRGAAKGFENGPGANIEPPVTFISHTSLSVPFDKAFIETEADVDSFLESMRKSLLAEIRSGKRITV
ncbi:BREX system P-loop protein BrxC [Mesorhizobium sp. M8A.F.Ca.ET.207.01.1.1]|uniref:BREX system P-loop protein BrxC n=1 Tax=Mesorhizobium sp. M8A.F.Ca.ET.207.01.1.1 TaxID=2563968 RepID=UPI00109CE41C|nr:BREX system P-loop protein BrxC [Mesorhizobium sp. M8A.F.Ca.ET.207.01.1.1]TGQ80136.1 BREX system P-loop protein BrxC [Mesorhizobium sp. M8A.F.Ca.ET.207.01.1.1]